MAAEFAMLAKRFQNILRKGTGIMDEKKHISTSEAAEFLGVAEITVRKYVQRGLLQAEKVGNTWVIRVEDVRAFVKPKPGRPSNEPEV